MALLIRCVPLPWDCDTPYSQIIQAAAASQRSWIEYARRYQNALVWESQEPSSVCQCQDIIMSLIPHLHIKLARQAGSTSWLYFSRTIQLNICSMLAGCLLNVCSMSARLCKRGISDRVLYFTGKMDSLDTPACPLSYTRHLLPAHYSNTEQLEIKEGIDKT